MAAAHLPLHPQGDRFVPSQAQRRFLEQAHAGDRHRSLSELLLNTGLSRSTYYRWAQDPGFRNWFAKGFAARQLFEGWHLINIARRKAADNFQYWKALRDLTFDPKGYALLQGWSETCASATLDEAHDLGPDDDSEFMDKLVLPPQPRFDFATWAAAFASLAQRQGVPPSTEPDQSLTQENGTLSSMPSVNEVGARLRDPASSAGAAGSGSTAPSAGPDPVSIANSSVPPSTEPNQSLTTENGTDQKALSNDPGPTPSSKEAVPPPTQSDQRLKSESGTNPARSYQPPDRPIFEPWHSSVPPKF